MAYDINAFGELSAYRPGSLFDQYFSYEDKANHKFIFSASAINTEIISFIQEVEHKRNIFLYFDTFNKSLHDDATKNNIQCLVHQQDTKNIKNLKSTIKIDTMFSEHLLNSFDKQKQLSGIDIIANLNGLEHLPESLNTFLYPKNKKLNIKMFDGGKISHPQNLGWVDDQTFLELINNCRILVAPTNTFLTYGLLLKKPTIALENNNWIKKIDLTEDLLLDESKIPEPSLSIKDIRRVNSYKNFIEKNIL
jgi:hypothetical protein